MGKINIYYGAANRDKDRFMFDSIASVMPTDTILLVPDQYTLQAERNALEYLNTSTLFELSVMSRTGFIHHIVEAHGGLEATAVDDYGRFMLLAKLAADEIEDEIRISREKDSAFVGSGSGGIFDSARKDRSFINMVNDFITEMKQFGIKAGDFISAADSLDESEGELLKAKLKEISNIYEKYENLMIGKFSDREDLLIAVADKIPESEKVAGSIFWVDGLETLTPKTIMLLEAIARTAPELNIILSDDGSGSEAFHLSADTRRRIREMAQISGTALSEILIPDEYTLDLKPELKLIAADDIYSEAETAAVLISELVRDKGYRYKDIYMLCNDTEMRGSAIRRIFDLYNIPLFMDTTKRIYQDPAIHFLLSMLDIISHRRRISDVFSMLKTGYGPLEDEETEELENYCIKYNIRNAYWKNDFKYGVSDEGNDVLSHINELRSRTDDFLNKADGILKGLNTVRCKTEAIWRFITEVANMPEKLETAAAELEKSGNIEYAERTAQVWKSIIGIFDQIVEVLGDEILSDSDYTEILRQGFEKVHIGILPTNNDQVICGALPRSLTGRVKAMFILGANDGILPARIEQTGLLSDDEKSLIEKSQGITFGRRSDFYSHEHNMALTLNLSRAEKLIYVSYSQTDYDGNPVRPSELVSDILRKHTDLYVEKDALHDRAPYRLAQNNISILPHLTSEIRKYIEGYEIEEDWYAVMLALYGSDSMESLLKNISVDIFSENLEKDKVLPLYGKLMSAPGEERTLRLSTSAIEQYSRCPFSFFLSRGLRPAERRKFEIDMRSLGDIYHECLRSVASALTKKGIPITSENSLWMTVTREECVELVEKSIESFTEIYREKIFDISNREKYVRKRVSEICTETAMLMISQVREGNINAIYFEQVFSNSEVSMFPGVRIELNDGSSVVIEGEIDRVDIISDDERSFVKIIDYKSGYEKFNLDEVKSGWRLQLMIYLKGAMGGIADSEPAGVFYFHIKEKDTDVSNIVSESIESSVSENVKASGRMDGIFLENSTVISGLDGNFENKSYIVKLKRNKDGSLKSSGMLNYEDFSKLIEITDVNLHKAASGIMEGFIDIRPLKGKSSDACKYCSGRSICNIALKE